VDRAEVAVVLRVRSVVAEHEVLVRAQMDCRERRRLDVVGLRAVDEDAVVAADDRVAGKSDQPLLEAVALRGQDG
jgi:hypothetical protein